MGLSLKKKQERWAKRLSQLADYLQNKVKPAEDAGKVGFYMGSWAEFAKPRPELTCGTQACAAGFATNIFAKSGFIMREIRGSEGQTFYDVYDKNNRRSQFGACVTFFGTDVPFDPATYRDDECNGDDASISRVVAELRYWAKHPEKLGV
jgi:hypothetical protein